jgi:hypothetical protein
VFGYPWMHVEFESWGPDVTQTFTRVTELPAQVFAVSFLKDLRSSGIVRARNRTSVLSRSMFRSSFEIAKSYGSSANKRRCRNVLGNISVKRIVVVLRRPVRLAANHRATRAD